MTGNLHPSSVTFVEPLHIQISIFRPIGVETEANATEYIGYGILIPHMKLRLSLTTHLVSRALRS